MTHVAPTAAQAELDEEGCSSTAHDEHGVAMGTPPTRLRNAFRMAAVAAAVAGAVALAVAAGGPGGARGQRGGSGLVELTSNAYFPTPEMRCGNEPVWRNETPGGAADCQARCEQEPKCAVYTYQGHACDKKWFKANGCSLYEACESNSDQCYQMYMKMAKVQAQAR